VTSGHGIRLSVVLVNYRTTALAEACLRSLRDNLRLDGVEVILVDNATPGFDPATLHRALPGLTVVEAEENLGFGRGNNLGARYASGEYLWLLNTDTLVPERHHLGELLTFLDRNPAYAAAAPLLTDADGVVQPWQTGYFPALWRMALSVPARAVARLMPAVAPRFGGIDTNFRPIAEADVEQAVAAALVVRRHAYEAVGGFSPEYFFFLEDTDLCRKLRQRGWRIRWLPRAHIVHLWGRSITDPVGRQRLFFTGQDLYFRRWHSRPARWTLRLLRVPSYLAVRWRARRSHLERQQAVEEETG
jgi:GT2 family glycosyltransferase